MQELKRKSSGNKSRIAVFDAVKFWSDVRSTPRKVIIPGSLALLFGSVGQS
ncbi:hypothetical protein PGTUg99_013510 [Puccinia graminis f. sp. tritici]|uniref:Uncharacterized protein n=1 Tax=Puccinia graminis f. sp. tritici TaxID=56615 RepID=A0A5B0QHF3_PUCGR|nr:hypothetical protein PGTUg99_013510 [Puccinia graminis f. sp. tritici]